MSFVLAAVLLSGVNRPLDIYFIDVMGGASTLIVTPERESVLIDSGWPGRDDRDLSRKRAIRRHRASGQWLTLLRVARTIPQPFTLNDISVAAAPGAARCQQKMR